MKSRNLYVLKIAALATSLTVIGTAQAQSDHSWTFKFDRASNDYVHYSKNLHPAYEYTATNGAGEDLSLALSGWQVSSDGNTNMSHKLRHWSGLGIEDTTSEPWHGIDNKTGEEFAVFDFRGHHDVVLDEFEFSYVAENVEYTQRVCFWWHCWNEVTHDTSYSDADSTVLYRQKSRAVASGIGDLANNSLTSLGYEVLGHYLDVGRYEDQQTAPALSQSAHPTSSVWAIGSFIASVHKIGDYISGGSIDHFADAVKLKSITVSKKKTPPGDVPVPATLALLALGLLTMRGNTSKLRA